MRAKRWYDYLWLWTLLYFALGFFNILFAWLGMIDFLLPLLIAAFGGNKFYCNNLCGRGQLFDLLGRGVGLSCNRPTPTWMASRRFRYIFLAFFAAMFGNMLFQTWLVVGGACGLSETVQLFWSLRLPWNWAYTAGVAPEWAAQFSFGLYSVMLTSALTGLVAMALYRPRTWCAFCPMGTVTQDICRFRCRADSREK